MCPVLLLNFNNSGCVCSPVHRMLFFCFFFTNGASYSIKNMNGTLCHQILWETLKNFAAHIALGHWSFSQKDLKHTKPKSHYLLPQLSTHVKTRQLAFPGGKDSFINPKCKKSYDSTVYL